MAEIIHGTPIHWAPQRCTVKPTTANGGAILKVKWTEATYTKQSELEVLKGERGDVESRVYHGFTQVLKLVGYPVGTDIAEAEGFVTPDVADRVLVNFHTGAATERNGWYEVTNCDNGGGNMSHHVMTLDLIYSVDQTTT